VKKSFNSYVMVEDKEFVIVYNIYNIGDEDALEFAAFFNSQSAFSVSLSDDSPEQVATIIGRAAAMHIGRVSRRARTSRISLSFDPDT